MSQSTSTSTSGNVTFGLDAKSNLWLWAIVAGAAVLIYFISKRK